MIKYEINSIVEQQLLSFGIRLIAKRTENGW